MIKHLTTLVAGLLMGMGMSLSGMMDPAKVLGFFHFLGGWDPTLALVMVGALSVSVPAFALMRGRSTALLGDPLQFPTRSDIDWRLVSGALLFGVGWGLTGFCPGPAISALASGVTEVFLFCAAMLVGMLVHRWTAG